MNSKQVGAGVAGGLKVVAEISPARLEIIKWNAAGDQVIHRVAVSLFTRWRRHWALFHSDYGSQT